MKKKRISTIIIAIFLFSFAPQTAYSQKLDQYGAVEDSYGRVISVDSVAYQMPVLYSDWKIKSARTKYSLTRREYEIVKRKDEKGETLTPEEEKIYAKAVRKLYKLNKIYVKYAPQDKQDEVKRNFKEQYDKHAQYLSFTQKISTICLRRKVNRSLDTLSAQEQQLLAAPKDSLTIKQKCKRFFVERKSKRLQPQNLKVKQRHLPKIFGKNQRALGKISFLDKQKRNRVKLSPVLRKLARINKRYHLSNSEMEAYLKKYALGSGNRVYVTKVKLKTTGKVHKCVVAGNYVFLLDDNSKSNNEPLVKRFKRKNKAEQPDFSNYQKIITKQDSSGRREVIIVSYTVPYELCQNMVHEKVLDQRYFPQGADFTEKDKKLAAKAEQKLIKRQKAISDLTRKYNANQQKHALKKKVNSLLDKVKRSISKISVKRFCRNIKQQLKYWLS